MPQDDQLAISHVAEPSVGQMLQAFLQSPEGLKNVEVAERMFALLERSEARKAEREFADAFANLQRSLPKITADTEVPMKGGGVKYKYAKLEDIFRQVRPALQDNGFTVTFSSEIKEDRVTQYCTMQHTGGHKRTNNYSARIGSGPIHSSPAQADGAAATYAKRQAFCDALNIVVSTDTDGAPEDVRDEGKFIPEDKAIYLREQVAELKYNEANFFMLAGVEFGHYEQITEGKYPVMINALDMKRRAAK